MLFIGDILGNAEALPAVMEAERDADHVVFFGDALLSGPQPNESAELLAAIDMVAALVAYRQFLHWHTGGLLNGIGVG